MPSQTNGQIDAAVAQLRALVRPATRTTGEGTISDFESKLNLQTVPDRWSFDGKNEEAMRGLQSFLDGNRVSYAKRLGLPTPPPTRKVTPSGWSIREKN